MRWKSPDQGFLCDPANSFRSLKRTALSSSSISSCSHPYAACCANGSTPGLSRAPCRSACRGRSSSHALDFVETVHQAESPSTPSPTAWSELEFTESIFFDNVALLSSAVHELRRAGIKCSIDDFGAGYSSLNVLKALPVSVLKLDWHVLPYGERR